jgi:hypothetical protein
MASTTSNELRDSRHYFLPAFFFAAFFAGAFFFAVFALAAMSFVLLAVASMDE